MQECFEEAHFVCQLSDSNLVDVYYQRQKCHYSMGMVGSWRPRVVTLTIDWMDINTILDSVVAL